MSTDPKKKTRIFAYGMLKPEYDLPATATDVRHDSVRGHLYDLGADAALVNIGNHLAPWIRGYSMLVDDEELKKIEDFEKPQYVKTHTETWSGLRVELFAYKGQIPKKARSVTNWVQDPVHTGRKAAAAKVK